MMGFVFVGFGPYQLSTTVSLPQIAFGPQLFGFDYFLQSFQHSYVLHIVPSMIQNLSINQCQYIILYNKQRTSEEINHPTEISYFNNYHIAFSSSLVSIWYFLSFALFSLHPACFIILTNSKMESGPTPQSITIKLASMMALIIIDLFLNSFIQSSFSLSFQSQYRVNYYFIPIQIIVTGFIFVMVLVLLWQTFPLRYGLLSTLIQQFKWTFIVLLFFLAITALERGIRLSEAVKLESTFNDSTIWTNGFYTFLYYLRYLSYPVFYGFLLSFSLKVIEPSYYKPDRWLK